MLVCKLAMHVAKASPSFTSIVLSFEVQTARTLPFSSTTTVEFTEKLDLTATSKLAFREPSGGGIHKSA
jgi:hypothetical protein